MEHYVASDDDDSKSGENHTTFPPTSSSPAQGAKPKIPRNRKPKAPKEPPENELNEENLPDVVNKLNNWPGNWGFSGTKEDDKLSVSSYTSQGSWRSNHRGRGYSQRGGGQDVVNKPKNWPENRGFNGTKEDDELSVSSSPNQRSWRSNHRGIGYNRRGGGQDMVNKLKNSPGHWGFNGNKEDDELSVSSCTSQGSWRSNHRGRGYSRRGGGQDVVNKPKNWRGNRGFNGTKEDDELSVSSCPNQGSWRSNHRGRGGRRDYSRRGGGAKEDDELSVSSCTSQGSWRSNCSRRGGQRGYGGRGGHHRGGDLDTMEWRIFKEILHRSVNGRAPIALAHKIFRSNYTVAEVIDWCRHHQQKFMVFENDNLEPTYVGVHHFRCRLCFRYNDSGCHNKKCTYIHICRAFICGYCAQGPNCYNDHHFQSEHNKAVFARMGLGNFDSEDLKKIVQCSNLQVCGMYNNRKSCQYSDACYRLHVCENFVENKCGKVDCQYAHDFDSESSQRLLKLFDLQKQVNINVIKKNIFVNRRQFQQANHPRGGQGHGRGRGLGRDSRHGSRHSSRQQSRRNSDEENEEREVESLMSIGDFKKKRNDSAPQRLLSLTRGNDASTNEDLDYYPASTISPTEHVPNHPSSKSSVPKPEPRKSQQEERINDSGNIPICLNFVQSLSLGSAVPCSAGCTNHHVRGMYMWQVKLALFFCCCHFISHTPFFSLSLSPPLFLSQYNRSFQTIRRGYDTTPLEYLYFSYPGQL